MRLVTISMTTDDNELTKADMTGLHLLDGLVIVLGVDAVCGTQVSGHAKLAAVGVDCEDAAGLCHHGSMHASKRQS